MKLVKENVKMSYGKAFLQTVWIKDEDDNSWNIALVEEYDGDLFYLELISEALNGWSYKYSNTIVKNEEWYDCELCGSYKQTDILMKFDHGNLCDIEEYYSEHFGDGTTDEELIEQFKKVGITLTIEYTKLIGVVINE